MERRPERTCVACRSVGGREDLLRLVVIDGAIGLDPSRSAPGRGAWVHATRECLERAERERGRLRHALRTETWLRSSLVPMVVADAQARLVPELRRAADAGALVSGTRLLREGLAAQRVIALVAARDASTRTLTELTSGSEIPWIRCELDRTLLGQILHRGPRAAVGAVRSAATEQLVVQLHRVRLFG